MLKNLPNNTQIQRDPKTAMIQILLSMLVVTFGMVSYFFYESSKNGKEEKDRCMQEMERVNSELRQISTRLIFIHERQNKIDSL